MNPTPLVRHLDQTQPLDCPYGHVRRIVTGGEGGIANVHVVEVTRGTAHRHTGYAETYYVLAGTGTLTMGEPAQSHALRPGSVAIIPAGTAHALESDSDQPLRFVIFGTPPLPLDDERARPQKP